MIFSFIFIINLIVFYLILYLIVFYLKLIIEDLASEGTLGEIPGFWTLGLKNFVSHIITIIIIYFIKTVYRISKCMSNSNFSFFSIWWNGCIPDVPDN